MFMKLFNLFFYCCIISFRAGGGIDSGLISTAHPIHNLHQNTIIRRGNFSGSASLSSTSTGIRMSKKSVSNHHFGGNTLAGFVFPRKLENVGGYAAKNVENLSTVRRFASTVTMSALKPHIAKLATGRSMSFEEARDAFDIIMSGDATPGQIGAFVMALRVRGESVSELSGAVATMRAKMRRVEAPDGAIDIVGTGGDNSHSLNISTASAIVVAATGVPVAKHGNRGLSSSTGSADVLTALGVNIDIAPEGISRCIHKAGVGFMFAPAHHPAMKYVGPTRVELGTRTIFNLLGPLSNPAGVTRQLVGVFLPEWIMPVAETLKALGADHVWVVHGDGYDEISATGETQVAELVGGTIRNFSLTPEAVGLKRHAKRELRGGDAQYNANALRDMLAGAPGAYRDTVLMNAGAGMVIAGKAPTLGDGIEAAAHAIDSGRALAVLDKLVEISNA